LPALGRYRQSMIVLRTPFFGPKGQIPPLLFWGRLSVLVFFFCLFAPPASAKETPDIRPVLKSNGDFGFCLAEHPYADGRKLTIALSPMDEINLGLVIPNAGFEAKKPYDLTITLKPAAEEAEAQDFVRAVRAMAMDENSLLFQMSTSAPFKKALKASNVLNVQAGGKSLDFALPAMPAALENLKACNKQHGHITASSKAAETQPPKTADTPSPKTANAADGNMPEALKALLFEAGVKDLTLLRTDKIPEDQRPADIVWKTGNLIGGLRERIVPADKTLDELIGLHLEGLKKKCSGEFKANIGREEEAYGLKMRAVNVECRMITASTGKNDIIMGALLFYLTPARRFTFFTHETGANDKAAAITVRDGIRNVLIKLAKQNAKNP
jgi:hypothetical protein